jgi:hypothetical protein
MKLLPRAYYLYRRTWKRLAIFSAIAGPGIIAMVADNNASGITTYAVTGSRYGFNLVWLIMVFCRYSPTLHRRSQCGLER